jgi:hypothetical protein
MGSYSGSSDWDDLPSSSDSATFAPQPVAQKTKDADDEPLAVAAPATKKPLDLILAFDTTGSMRPWIQNVREKVEYLSEGLFKLMDIRISLIGVGDHCDGRFMLQIHPFTHSLDDMKQAVHDIRNTSGGDFPEAFECLFKNLNERSKFERPTVLVLITDSVPHGMSGQGDGGCPDNVDARAELATLMPKVRSFYLVNVGNHEASIQIQKTMVKSENYFLQLTDFRRLTNLVMAVCMDEVGELDYFMGLLEKQRGKDRKEEVLALLRR